MLKKYNYEATDSQKALTWLIFVFEVLTTFNQQIHVFATLQCKYL